MTPRLVRVEDPRDPCVAAFLNVRERDLVGRQGGFIAEGEVVLAAAVRSGRHRLDSLLISERRIDALGDILACLDEETPVHVASQAVLDAIVGFNLHRGVLAFGAQAPRRSLDELLGALPARATVVVLYGVANHDNIGGIFRNAAAFGADAVVIDPACCDPYYRKAIRVSVGACLTTPFVRLGPGEDAVAALQAAGFAVFALSPGGAEALIGIARPDRVALLLGAEGPGLAPDILARVRAVRIEMAGELDSLNVATASGIALHHFTSAIIGPTGSV